MTFENKAALIVGSTGGIGSAVLERFIELNGKALLFSRNNEKLEKQKKQFGNKVEIYTGNATNLSNLTEAVALCIEKFGKLDILIHSVGSIVLKSLSSLDEEKFRETIELNLISPFLSFKAVLPSMLKNKSGSVVAVSSVAGSKGLINHEAISAAKGGLESLIKSAAITYAKKGIRFNAVALGLVNTPLASFLTSNELSLKASISMHPMNIIGEARDAAEGILYLASENSKWVTGEILHIDGGMKAS